MKKAFLTILISLFLVVPATAVDWTDVTAAYCPGAPFSWGEGVYMYCFEITAVSNADSSGDHALSTMLQTAYGKNEKDRLMRDIQGAALYWVDYVPSSAPNAPTTAPTITIDKESTTVAGANSPTAGFLIFSELVSTAATSQSWKGDIDTQMIVPIKDLTIAMTTLADTKVAMVRIWLYGGRK